MPSALPSLFKHSGVAATEGRQAIGQKFKGRVAL